MSFFSWLRNRTSNRSTRGRAQHRAAAPRFRPQLEALEDRCVPSTLKVVNTADYGPGSLPYEIAQAQSSDTIVFDFSTSNHDRKSNSTPHTITLIGGELVINKNLTIQGPGAGLLTIASQPYLNGIFEPVNGSRIFEVDGAGTTVAISGLTLTQGGGTKLGGGYTGNPYDGYGGAILNFGKLTLSNCTLGPVVIAGVIGSGNTADIAGGGIANFGTLVVSGCTLSGNSAYGVTTTRSVGGGGGIYNAGTEAGLTVTNSTFRGNSPDAIFGPYTDGGGNTFC
jgi:hypothetical protein